MNLAILAMEASTPGHSFKPQNRDLEFVPQLAKSYSTPLALLQQNSV